MKEDISHIAKGINALPKELKNQAIDLMNDYSQYVQSVATTYTDAVGEACKDLMTIAGVNTDLVNKDTAQAMKDSFKRNGFELVNQQFNSVLIFNQIILRYKGEFIAAVIVWLDPITSVITNRMYDSQETAFSDVKKLSKGELPNG